MNKSLYITTSEKRKFFEAIENNISIKKWR